MERRRGIERTRAMWAAVKDVARKEIVKLDEHLFDFFGKRLKEAHFIGKAKTHLGESVVDPKRGTGISKTRIPTRYGNENRYSRVGSI